MNEEQFLTTLRRDYEYDIQLCTWFLKKAVITGPPGHPRLGRPARIAVSPFGITDRVIADARP